MLIEPNANNSIKIITRVKGITYEISDSDELGLCIVRADHTDIEVEFTDRKSQKNISIGKNFMLHLK